MTCRLFNTNKDQVTPVGFWLANKLNSLFDFIWPFVRQRSYDKMCNNYLNSERGRHELIKQLEEFEDWHYASTEYLPPIATETIFSSKIMLNGATRFSLELNPVCNYYECHVFDRKDKKLLTENIKNSLIRLTRNKWADNAEHAMKQYFREVY